MIVKRPPEDDRPTNQSNPKHSQGKYVCQFPFACFGPVDGGIQHQGKDPRVLEPHPKGVATGKMTENSYSQKLDEFCFSMGKK